MRIFFIIINLCFILQPAFLFAEKKLPTGYKSYWFGMSVRELKNISNVEDTSLEGKYFAEHLEWKPDVYTSIDSDGKRVECYFYNNKLYKIFVFYHGKKNSNPKKSEVAYERVLADFKLNYGDKNKYSKEVMFGLLIKHNVWEDNVTKMDLRLGAGYVYNVIFSKGILAAKTSDMINGMNEQKRYKSQESEIIEL